MTETSSPSSERVAWREVMNRQYAAPLTLVCLGVWLHAADALIVATMMPAIVADLGAEHYVAWTVALYELGSIIAGASAALLALRRGIRLPMSVAASVFALGCLISALAPNMELLLAGRLLQGLGGGGLTALAFIAVARLFPTRLLARVMAVISVLWGGSAFLGPMIGGFFVEYASWRGGFLFFGAQAAFLALWITFGLRIPEAARDEDAQRIPIRRLAILALAVLLIASAGVNVSFGRTSLLLLGGLVSLGVFLRMDAGHDENRLLPSDSRNVFGPIGAVMGMSLLLSAATMGLATYGALLMFIIHGTPVLVAGYVLASVAITWTFAAVVVSGAPERHDLIYIRVGISLVCASVAALAYAVSYGPVWLIAVCGAMEGLGYGMCWSFVLRRAKTLAPEGEIERLVGALSTTGRFGYALGASIMGILANGAGFALSMGPESAGYVARVIFLGSVPIALLSWVLMLVFTRSKFTVGSSVAPSA